MRKPSVTRTVGFYEKTVKVYKQSTDEVLTITVTTSKDTDKAVKDSLDKDLRFITVTNTVKKQGIYTMPLDFFIANSTLVTDPTNTESEE